MNTITWMWKQIVEELKLKMYNPAAMRGSNPATFAQVLLAAGVMRQHTKYGNVYLVKPLKAE